MNTIVKSLSDMKILLATECGGHPFWQRNSYAFTMIDTESESATELSFYEFFNKKDESWQYGEVEYYIRKNGIYARFYSCGSGFGKVPRGDEFLLIPRNEYDKVIILPSEEKRKAELEYNGNWQNNSDFE